MFHSFEELVNSPIAAFNSILGQRVQRIAIPSSSRERSADKAFVAHPTSDTVVRGQTQSGSFPADVTQLTERDRRIIGQVEKTLEDALQLKRWWERVDETNAYQQRFELIRKFNRPDASFGFFDEATLGHGTTPVMGEVEDMFYDQPKSADVETFQRELREFVLHYFLRISDYRRPEAYLEARSRQRVPGLELLSWCPDEDVERRGFGYSQVYYKLRTNGQIGKFAPDKQDRIVDLRRIGDEFEWVVVKVNIFNFRFEFEPFGSGLPQVAVPLQESSYLLLSRDFIVDDETASVDRDGQRVQGRYGFGYAFLRDPGEDLLGYGPGQFDVAFQSVNFRVLETGATRACLVFVANRPRQIVNLPIAPVDWSFRIADALTFGATSSLFGQVRRALDRPPLRWSGLDPVLTYVTLANLSSGGLASKQLCISKELLEKVFLVRHFVQHYDMLTGSLQTWRRVPNWLDADSLPEWVRTGVTS